MRSSLKRPLYLCKRIKPGEKGYCEGASTYAAPVKKTVNAQNISGDLILQFAGNLTPDSIRLKLPWRRNDFERGDMVYEADTVGNYEELCSNADYDVYSVNRVGTYCNIVLRSRS